MARVKAALISVVLVVFLIGLPYGLVRLVSLPLLSGWTGRHSPALATQPVADEPVVRLIAGLLWLLWLVTLLALVVSVIEARWPRRLPRRARVGDAPEPPARAPRDPASRCPAGHDMPESARPASGTGPLPGDSGPTPQVVQPVPAGTGSAPGESAALVTGAAGDHVADVAGAPARTASPADATAAASGSRQRRQPPGIDMPAGWVDLGLASEIAAAAELVWAHRSRRYRPSLVGWPGIASGDDPDLTPLPAVVTYLRRRLRETLAVPEDLGDGGVGAGVRPATGAASRLTTRTVATRLTASMGVAAAVVPALGGVLTTAWPAAGLGLAGPGGAAAARGFLIAALARGGVGEKHRQNRVVVPVATLVDLLGTSDLSVAGGIGRLIVTRDLPDALAVVREQAGYRAGLLHSHHADDVLALRRADPGVAPLPPLLLIAQAPVEPTRVAEMLADGRRLDIHGVLLGAWPDGETVRIATNGTTAPAGARDTEAGAAGRRSVRLADVSRLAVLTPADTLTLLRTLAEAHTGQAPPSVSHVDASAPGSGLGAARACPGPVRQEPAVRVRTDAGGARGQHRASPRLKPPRRRTGLPSARSWYGPFRALKTSAAVPDAPAPAMASVPARARVRLLGRPLVRDLAGTPELVFRSRANELLVYLAVHPGGVDEDQIIEEIFGGTVCDRTGHQLDVLVSKLRVILTRAGGPADYVTHELGRYLLNPAALEMDLWAFHSRLAAAGQAHRDGDAVATVTQLRAGLAVVAGPLADGCDYEWLEPHRLRVQRSVIDAYLALAQCLAATEPAEALAVLAAGIRHCPYTEELYRQAMLLHARAGDADVIADLRGTLTRRLAELDAAAEDETLALAGRLIAEPRRRGPRHARVSRAR